MKIKWLFFTVLIITTTFVKVANATPMYSFDTPGNSFTNGSWDFAYNFEVVNELTVSGLGYYADPTTQAVDDNAVALYDSFGALLASAVVTNAYPVFDYFRYVTIPELSLAPGMYQLVGVSNGDNYTWNNVNHVFHSDINYISNTWLEDDNGTADFLTTEDKFDTELGYSGANMFFGDPEVFVNPVTAPATGIVILMTVFLFATGRFKLTK